MKSFAFVLAALLFASAAYAGPFSDVPRTHWAYDAIQKAVSAGILQGYDGKFHGKRLLNRYQMAVITAKLLDQMGKGGTVAAPSGDVKRMIANLEALTIEFADELALLNVKVSTLEDSFAELKGGCAKPCAVSATGNGDLGFTAFAAFSLIDTDDQAAVTASGVRTRYNNADTMFFDMTQVSIGVDKEVNPGVYFHAQFDFNSQINTFAGVGVNEAFFFVDELFGDIGAKMGAFALPFSMEHNGPFRSCNLTITPSAINSMFEAARPYGLELQKTKDVQPGDINWKFGIVSGTDLGFGTAPRGFLTDVPAIITNSTEADDGFGFYISIGKKAEKGGLGWNLSFMDNGGDNGAVAPVTATAEASLFNLGLEWSNDDILVLLQYMSGGVDSGVGADYDMDAFYLLFNYKVDEKQSITLRYDDFSSELNGVGGGDFDGGNAITFAYNRKVTENSMFQFEYLTVDVDEPGAVVDQDDDLIQLRYKVHF